MGEAPIRRRSPVPHRLAIGPFEGAAASPGCGQNETASGVIGSRAVETGQRQGRRGPDGSPARYDRTIVPLRIPASSTGSRVGGLLHHGPHVSAGERHGRNGPTIGCSPSYVSRFRPEALTHPSTTPEELRTSPHAAQWTGVKMGVFGVGVDWFSLIIFGSGGLKMSNCRTT